MKPNHQSIVARITLLALALTCFPASTFAGTGVGRLEGLLLNVDGRAATDHRVHLIDAEGRDVAAAETSEGGIYSFPQVESGAYSLGIENPQGQIAPVASPPIQVADNALVRRDIKLMQATPGMQDAVGKENFSFGLFWAGLSPAAKAWAIIGTLVFVGITFAALDNEDNESPFEQTP